MKRQEYLKSTDQGPGGVTAFNFQGPGGWPLLTFKVSEGVPYVKCLVSVGEDYGRPFSIVANNINKSKSKMIW